MNVFYPRSLISLIIILSFIEEKKIKKNKNILILENIYFLNFVKTLSKKNLLNKYFKSIELVSTTETRHIIFSYNYLKLYFYINNRINQIKKNPKIKKILNIKFKKFYGGGTFLDEVFYKNNKNADFYFVEHGIGNIINFIFFNRIKSIINYFIKSFLNIVFFNSMLKYKGYVGILNKKFSSNIYINHCKIKENIKIKPTTVKKIFKIFLNIYKYSPLLIKNKKNKYILFNWNFLIKPNLKIINQIFKKHNVNSKNNVLIIKLHNKEMYNNSNNFKLLINFLNKKKIKFLILGSRISFLPLEFIVYFYNIKNIISAMSSTVFYMSILDPKIKSSLYYSLNKKIKKKYLSLSLSSFALNIYRKKFKNITFY